MSPLLLCEGGDLQAVEGGVTEGKGNPRHTEYGGDADNQMRKREDLKEEGQKWQGKKGMGEGGRKRAARPCSDSMVWKYLILILQARV